MKIRRFISKMDTPLLISSIILIIFGLLNIVNASSQAVVLRYGTGIYYYFVRQLVFIIIGFFAFLFIIKIPTKKYPKLIKTLYLIVFGLLVYLYMFGRSHMGSLNWIDIKGFRFQPSELAKPVLIIAISVLFEQFYSRLNDNRKYTRQDHFKMIGIIAIVGLIFPGLVFLQKDLGTTIILAFILFIMFLASPIQKIEKRQVFTFGLVVLMFAALVFTIKSGGKILSEEQRSRLDFIDPCSSYEEGGYQICNGFIAINSGGLFGVGIGNSKQVSYLPESHTDSVFAIIAEEYGFLFCTFIFGLYLVMVYRIFNLASRVESIRNKYICLGIGSYIMIHIIINLGGLFGSMPLTGVPLPFLSYGGTYTIALICSLSVVQRICIEKNTDKIKIR